MGTHRITVELADEAYQHLRRLVDSGEYESEGEAMADFVLDAGLPLAPVAGDPIFDQWMRDEVLAADDELEADPSRGLTSEELQSELAAARLARARPR